MACVKPFCALRPAPEYASRIAALPYDVFDREEALLEVTKEPLSFLHIDRPETWFDAAVDIHDKRVYTKAREVLYQWIEKGYFIKEKKPCYYVYEQTLGGRTQTGIAACALVEDYLGNVIKKHEHTRREKEQDRICHIRSCMAQTGPIFLAYRAHAVIDAVVEQVKLRTPIYDFTASDGVHQRVWIMDEDKAMAAVEGAFGEISDIYIADGHHRAASAVRVSQELKGKPGVREADRFLAVLFPEDQLEIQAYNRIVRDLNGLDEAGFLQKISKAFDVESCPEPGNEKGNPFPPRRGAFGMYLKGQWHILTAHKELLSKDGVDGLDVSILQNYLLDPILGIKDVRTDRRIDFVGGVHGLFELKRRCDTQGWAVAFALYPTAIEELFKVADSHQVMPPKSTWFEPKLRSGLFIHMLEN